MKVLYFGAIEHGYWAQEALQSDSPPGTIEFTGYLPSISLMPQKATEAAYDVLCVDVSQSADDPMAIQSVLERTKTVSAAKHVVVIAQGFADASQLVQGVQSFGFPVITSVTPGICKQQLLDILHGKAATPIAKQESIPQRQPTAVQQPAPILKPPAHRIGIAGTYPRIGTTTQTIQLIKYLQLMGHSACYVEMQGSGWVRELDNVLEDVQHPATGISQYAGIDFYDRPEVFASMLHDLNYDYILYDYGKFNAANSSFFDKDLQVYVCGVSPFEFTETTKVLSLPGAGSRYIFSFVSDADRPGILELMENRANATIFAPWTPDPFVYLSSANALYAKIIDAEPVKNETKRGLFRRKDRR